MNYDDIASFFTYSRACSCPDTLDLCYVTAEYGYPCSIEDMQVNIYDSFKCQIHHASSCSLDAFKECKVRSKTSIHFNPHSGLNNTSGDTNTRNGFNFTLFNDYDGTGCSAGDTYWFTNISFTCFVKQAAFRCQVGARDVTTHLGILDHASQICTNMTLVGGACGAASLIQITNISYYEDSSDYIESCDERCLKACLDQYVDLTDLDFQPHNYNSQATYSFKHFSILSENCISCDTFSQLVSNTCFGERYRSTDHSNNSVNTVVNSQLVKNTINWVVDSKVQVEVTREFGFMRNIANIQWSPYTPTTFQYTLSKEGLASIYQAVKAYNVPNYKGARIPVASGLKIDMWRYILKDYDLQIIADYLQYGFPLNVDHENFTYNENITNHTSATRNSKGVNKYFNTEVEELAMVGPMEESPFIKTHYSPIMARDKPDGSIRVIVDLSWPIGQGVNSYVPGDVFDEIFFTLKYPTIDLVVEKIRSMGPKALLFKVDLQRAFRNLRIDPLDYPLLGLKWQGNTYIDVALAFGFKNDAAACQLCTDVITHTLRRQKIWLMNYLDDYIGISNPGQAEGHFNSLLNLLDQVGLPVNINKVEAPSSVITCLGIQIDAKNGILSVPDKKLQEIKHLTSHWLQKTVANRRQLQSYIGKLIAIHRCVKPCRLFINGMLKVLRNTPIQDCIKLPGYFFQDVRWFHKFLDKFNSSVEIHQRNVKIVNVFVDASLQCTGGIYKIKCIRVKSHKF